ncbi:class I SAM-dependent methyltransferase [Pseudonocardia nematodicida]|uniref:Class I SAM-dependent methyltransferase n=1 Tax=Pseudonocardia nematodicida TaxID=1206997 RepID=A0ABV1KGI5_9PSEU
MAGAAGRCADRAGGRPGDGRRPARRPRPRAGVDVRHGDGAALPFPDSSFDAVVCFTMLHHVPSRAEQDRLFAEAARVLRPGGTFAGIDSLLSLRFRLIHVGDTMTVVDPVGLPPRLVAAGLDAPGTELGGRSFRFRADRPR